MKSSRDFKKDNTLSFKDLSSNDYEMLISELRKEFYRHWELD